MNDAKLTDCPEASCDGQVKRLLGTGGGIIFKGSGFYQTDYRSNSYKQGAKAEGPDAGGKPAEKPSGHSCSSGGCGCSSGASKTPSKAEN